MELRVLMLEDDALDAELAIALLAQAGYQCQWLRVETRAAFQQALDDGSYDLVVADYHLPSFDGPSALRLVRAHSSDLPFILVSGFVGEEQVIESLKAGATDYVLKDHLARLPPVVARALQEREEYRQRQHAEAARQQAERRYRELFENASDLLYTHDLDGRIDSVNRAVERLTGYRRDELVGRNIHQLVETESKPLWEADELPPPADAVLGINAEVICADGRRVPVEVTMRLIYEGEQAIGVQGSARDVSERRRLEAQVSQAQRLEVIGRLAGGIAHDFNNVLTAIIGNTQLALEGLNSNDTRYEWLQEIERFAGRAASLTSQLLAFSRRQRLERTAINLNEMVAELVVMLRRIIGADIAVNVALAPGVAHIWGDQSQIEQVVMNLVVNARDAMPGGGQLGITTRNVELRPDSRAGLWTQPGSYVELTVSDTGVGIDAETLPYIFEPFFTTKRDDNGTGLGLAVVYGVVKQHEGGVQVLSEPGRGTSFIVYLPVAP